MKKIAALVLTAVLLCSCFAALAESPALPTLGNFATMTTKVKNGVTNITLSKPVDKLYIAWPSELKLVELDIGAELNYSFRTLNEDTQPGVAKFISWLGSSDETLVATDKDRAYITVQGEWFVCYNRGGTIVDIAYAGADADIQAVRDLAFGQFREAAFDGFATVKIVNNKCIIVPADE